MDEQCPMPTPGPEHARLQSRVGRWNVECSYFMDPGQPPMQMAAVETIEPVGPFWTVSRFEADFMGQPFVGRATMGYDPRKEMYVGTWVDAMSNHLYVMEGRYDDGDEILTMSGVGPMPGSDELTTWRSTTEELDGGKIRFEMFMTMPHGEHKTMSYVYTRAE